MTEKTAKKRASKKPESAADFIHEEEKVAVKMRNGRSFYYQNYVWTKDKPFQLMGIFEAERFVTMNPEKFEILDKEKVAEHYGVNLAIDEN